MVPAWAVVIAAAGLAQPWQPVAALGACLLLLAGGYAAFVVDERASPWSLLAPMVVGSLVVSALGATGRGLAGYPMLALWLNLATLTMGILLRMRHAALGSLVVVATSLAVVWQEHQAQSVPLERSALLSVGTIAVAVGMLVAVPAGMLRRTAGDSDRVAVARTAAEVDAAIMDGRRVELRRVQRILHDTAMNTLGAVARWDDSDPASVAERCAEDLAILRRAGTGGADDSVMVLESIRRRAALLGIDLEVLATAPGADLPPGVAAALEGAAWETLNNIAKHLRDRRAFADWSWDGDVGHLRITDAGPGIDGLSWSRGGADSIVRRCAEAGVTAQIRSSAGSGTVVDLVWRGVPAASGPGPGVDRRGTARTQPLETLLAETLVRVCMVVACLGLIATTALPGAVPRWSSVVGVLAVVGLGVAAWAVQHGRAVWRVPAALWPVVALLGTWFTGFGQVGCARVGSWWWGSLVGITVCVAVILMDGRAWAVLATAAGFVAANAVLALGLGPQASDCLPDVVVDTLVGLAGLAGLWAFRHHLIDTWELGREQQVMLAEEQSRAAASAEAVRARLALLGSARAVAEPVLAGLAEGTLDPREPAVRARAARAEGTLRALGAVPVADPGGAGQALTDLVLSADLRGVALTLSLNADLEQGRDLVRGGAGMLARALELCPEGCAVQVTVLQAGDGLAALVLIDPRTPRQRLASAGDAGDQPMGDEGSLGGPAACAVDNSIRELVRSLAAQGWNVTRVEDEVLAETRWEDRA
jgi:signal transduction histidine kinase